MAGQQGSRGGRIVGYHRRRSPAALRTARAERPGAPVATLGEEELSWLAAARPPVKPLSISGYVVSDGVTERPDLPRAGDWGHCEPTCHRAAYMATVYPTLDVAKAAIPALAAGICDKTRPSGPAGMIERSGAPLAFRVFEIEAVDFDGRDYRRRGCAIPEWHDQLLHGDRHDPAWLEIERQRAWDSVEGVLLPGDELFLFVHAAASRLQRKLLVDTVLWGS